MLGAISPVYAPFSSQWQFCAPRATGMLSDSSTVCTERRSVNGGCTDTSTTSTSSLVNVYDSFWTRVIASKWLWCIFQLPEISGLRIRGSSQRLQAGQVPLLQQFQRRTTAGRHVVDPVFQ